VGSKAEKIEISFHVNGNSHTVKAYPMARLLDVLRENIALTGTKEGCGEGECGACSVLMDGTLVNTCLIPVLQAQGTQLQTIEGLADNGQLHPLQEAFIVAGGAQCGICTPGMILAAYSMLQRNSQPKDEEIREGLAGNLCRCTGYMKIVDSVHEAVKKLQISARSQKLQSGEGDS